MNAKEAQKERTHAAILESAGRLVREKGIDGASVAEVMKGADLTVGGFYAHFADKDALVDETIRRAGAATRQTLFRGLEEKPPAARAFVALKRYLSAAHRDGVSEGCALPAVVGEVATTAPEHAAVLGELIEGLASDLAEQLSTGDARARRQLALGLVALMYGGLSLARALRGSELSDEVLKAGRALGGLAIEDDR